MTKRSAYEIQSYAKECARQMQINPSPLEEKMVEFLDRHKLYYVFQKIFYIKEDGVISRFFIADFYLPDSKIILETDGKFHSKRIKHDAKRTELITGYYPDVKVIRWTFEDFNDNAKVEWLLKSLKG